MAEANTKADGAVQKVLEKFVLSAFLLHKILLFWTITRLTNRALVGNGYIYACYGLGHSNLQAQVHPEGVIHSRASASDGGALKQ